MFFNNLTEIPEIARKTSCSIFVVPPDILGAPASTEEPTRTTSKKPVKKTAPNAPALKNAIFLTPDESKATHLISVEQIRDFLALTNSRETRDRFFVITPANAMNEAAQNAFLKTFEEPKDFCHFVLLTETPGALLPTILSRAQVFFPRALNTLDNPPSINAKTPAAKAKILDQAKQLISVTPRDLPGIAADFAKIKTKPREQALDVISAAIELLYKSYFKTGNQKFLAKLPAFLHLHDAIKKGGHIKLHIVADLC